MSDSDSRTLPSNAATQGTLAIPRRRRQHARTARKTAPICGFLLMIFTRQPYFIGRDGLARIPPAIADIGEDMRHLFIGELYDGGHDAIIGSPVDGDWSRCAAQHDTHTPALIGHQEVRACEWGKDLRQALSIGLMADCTRLHEDKLAFLHLDLFGHGDDGRGLLHGLLDLFL